LAPREVKIALEALFGRFLSFARKDKQIVRVDSPVFRGPKTLPLTLA